MFGVGLAVVAVAAALVAVMSRTSEQTVASGSRASVPSSVLVPGVVAAPAQVVIAITGDANTTIPAPATSASGVELCGFGIAPMDEAGQEAYKRRVDAATVLANKRSHAALLTSASPDARAVGRFLSIHDAFAPLPSVDPDVQCGEDAACLARANADRIQTYEQATRAPRDSLVQMALDTHDPVAYGLAVEACGIASDKSTKRDGKCQLVTLEGWSRLDANNMLPWLALASAAAGRGDRSAADEAFHRASLSETYRLPVFAAAAIADAEMTNGYEPYERFAVQNDLFGTAMASPLIAGGPYSKYCSLEALRDANRFQVCDRLTTAMILQGPDLFTRVIALSVAEKRLGWPTAKTAPMRLEADMLTGRAMRSAPDEQSFDCAHITRLTSQLSRRFRIGELAAMRLEMTEAGETQEQALALNRAWRDNYQRGAAAAAAELAASAAFNASPASTPYSATPPPVR